MLRHTIATLAYRAAKALRGAPPEFAEISRRPHLAHPGRDSGAHGADPERGFIDFGRS
jgi:hypothetical protein